MEIIGSIASIAQVSRYALSLIATISGISQDIQDAPALQHQQIQQLARLFSIIQTLHQSAAFSTSSITKHLEAIVVKIQDLKVVLERLVAQQAEPTVKKYYKALIKDHREKHRISDVFNELEKDKSALLLSIAETQTELSAKIYRELTERVLCTQATQTEMSVEQKKTSTKGKAAKNSLASLSVNDSPIAKSSNNQDAGVEGRYPRANEGQPESKQDTAQAKRFIAVAIPKNGPSMANDASEKVTGHVFESVKFEESADILAGNIGESKCGAEHSQKHLYKNIEAKEGRAILGNVYVDDFTEKFLEKKK